KRPNLNAIAPFEAPRISYGFKFADDWAQAGLRPEKTQNFLILFKSYILSSENRGYSVSDDGSAELLAQWAASPHIGLRDIGSGTSPVRSHLESRPSRRLNGKR